MGVGTLLTFDSSMLTLGSGGSGGVREAMPERLSERLWITICPVVKHPVVKRPVVKRTLTTPEWRTALELLSPFYGTVVNLWGVPRSWENLKRWYVYQFPLDGVTPSNPLAWYSQDRWSAEREQLT